MSIIKKRKRIALVAHDNKKDDLLEWADFNKGSLTRHRLFATGTTGRLLEEALDIPVTRFNSGPLGGDQQIGAQIAEGKIDMLIFFWDPLAPMPHDPDIRALLRLCVVWNIPVASNRTTADFIFSSPLMDEDYPRQLEDYSTHITRMDDLLDEVEEEKDSPES